MTRTGEITAPEKLTPEHDISSFKSGEPALDDWLKRRAMANEKSGASPTYVICAGKRVVGYDAHHSGGRDRWYPRHPGPRDFGRRKEVLRTLRLLSLSRRSHDAHDYGGRCRKRAPRKIATKP